MVQHRNIGLVIANTEKHNEEDEVNNASNNITTTSAQKHTPGSDPMTTTFSTTYCVSSGSGGCTGVESAIFQMISNQRERSVDNVARDPIMLLTCVSGTLSVGERKSYDIYPFFFRTLLNAAPHAAEDDKTETIVEDGSIHNLSSGGGGSSWSKQLHAELSGWLNPVLINCPATRKAALRLLTAENVADTKTNNNTGIHPRGGQVSNQLQPTILWNLSIRVTIAATGSSTSETTTSHQQQQHQQDAHTTQYAPYAEDESSDSSFDLDLFGSTTSDDDGLIDEVD